MRDSSGQMTTKCATELFNLFLNDRLGAIASIIICAYPLLGINSRSSENHTREGLAVVVAVVQSGGEHDWGRKGS